MLLQGLKGLFFLLIAGDEKTPSYDLARSITGGDLRVNARDSGDVLPRGMS